MLNMQPVKEISEKEAEDFKEKLSSMNLMSEPSLKESNRFKKMSKLEDNKNDGYDSADDLRDIDPWLNK